MKILFLIHRYPPAVGGSERYIQEMARRLVGDGHTVTVYTSDQVEIEGYWQRGRPRLSAGLEDDRGVAVHRFPARVLPLHGAISRLLGLVPWPAIGLSMAPPGLVLPGLWRAVRAGGPFDLVHASAYPSLMYLGASLARRASARLVLMPCNHLGIIAARAYDPPAIDRSLLGLYHQADALIALTELERQMFLAAGMPETKIMVTGAGVHPNAARGADGNRFRHRFGVPAGSPVIAFIGHKTPGKGALHLLEMARTLLRDRPDVTLVMSGAPTADFVRRHRALPRELRPRVLDLYLAESEKQDLLAASSALILPSREDGFGIVLLEAWLHGKPVIGARAGGIPAIVEHGHSGLLVSYGDVDALAQAVTRLLDHPEQASEMGALGRERTLLRWTWGTVYDRLYSVLNRHVPRLPKAKPTGSGRSREVSGSRELQSRPCGNQFEAKEAGSRPDQRFGSRDPSW